MALGKKRYYIPVFLTLGVGTILSIVACQIVAKWETENRKAQFNNQADLLAIAVQQSIDTNLGMLRATGKFYKASHKVERQEFKIFVEDFLAKYHSILAFAWSPRVTAAERQAFEQAVRAEGYPTFEITEADIQGQIVRAKERPEYFPVVYSESLQNQDRALGFDLLSDPLRRLPLEKARDTGKIIASTRIKIITTQQLGFLIYQPLYRQNVDLSNLESRRKNFQGVTTAVFQIADIVKAALPGLELHHINFYLLDNFAAKEERFLSFYQSQNKQVSADLQTKVPHKIDAGKFCDPIDLCTRTVTVSDRQWSVLLIPQPEYMGIEAYWRSGITLLSVLFITFLVSIYLLLSSRHTIQVEKLVLEKTAQAKQMSEILKSLQQNMEILDLANDTIIICDLEKRITYWNQGAEKLYGWTKDECIGHQIHSFLQTVFPQPLGEIYQIFYEKDAWEGELIHTKKDGTQIIVASRWTLQRDEGGQAIAMLEINNDITQRKETEATLRQLAAKEQEKAKQLKQTLQELRKTQGSLIQTEKMSSLGQLVAGIAHEINNPVNFIYGNLTHTNEYIQDLLELVRLYQHYYPNPAPKIQEYSENSDLDFLIEDLPKMLSSMKMGAERIREIVLSLRNFSRLDEADMKQVDIHEGIDNTLLILQNRLKAKPEHPAIQIIKEYGNLPEIECYPGQLNQVFMNIITNAIDALDSYNSERSYQEIQSQPSWIKICTAVVNQATENKVKHIIIKITDNGPGMAEAVKKRLFDPFFTTKPVGKGTGLGLSISYQIIVEKHRGMLRCESEPGKGTEFVIEIPINQN